MTIKAPSHYSIVRTGSVLALALSLAACGGGGSGGGGTTGSGTGGTASQSLALSGSAADAPIANATITITAGAPLNATGATTLGTITADGNGNYTINVTLPSGSVPVFANAADPKNAAVILTSYIGQSDKLSAMTSANDDAIPDLDISPVTTAALAVYGQLNAGSYAGLTASAYATTLRTYRGDVLAIAAAIKAVGDSLCAPTTAPTSTTNLAAAIAAQANLSSGNSTTITTAANILGGTCPAILAVLPQLISADPHFGSELEIGDIIDLPAPAVPAGTYVLQGLVSESGLTAAHPFTATTAAPAATFDETAFTVDGSGKVTSTDGMVSGNVIGNLAKLTLQVGGQTYAVRAKIGVVASSLTHGGTVYSVEGGAANNSSSVLADVEAVIAPSGATPVWNGMAAPATAGAEFGVSCPAGAFAMRLEAFGALIGGASIGECVTPTASGWTMTASTSSTAKFSFYHSGNATSPSLAAPTWTAASTALPFVLQAPGATFTQSATLTGSAYYVMGSRHIVFATAGANNLFNVESNEFGMVQESGSGTNDH